MVCITMPNEGININGVDRMSKNVNDIKRDNAKVERMMDVMETEITIITD